MPDLVAQGPRRPQRWRKRLPQGIKCELGRRAGTFSASWDEHISRQHVTLHWDGRQLHVELMPNVPNPLFFNGEQVATASILPGEHFVLGETTFSLLDESAGLAAEMDIDVTELTFSGTAYSSPPIRGSQYAARYPESSSRADRQRKTCGCHL